MKHALLASAALLVSPALAQTISPPTNTDGVPAYDHIVVVVEENHGLNQIIGSPDAPFINSLANGGELMSNYSAVTHPSQPNYFALYAGSTFGVGDDNNHSESGPTLATTLQSAGKTFTGFVDSGSPQKHNPWESFPEGTSVEKPMSSFPSGNFSSLPNVSFVVPNLQNDMHDGTVAQGDAWLQQNLSAYAQWAKANNSLLVVTADEDDGSGSNKVPTILYGADVKPGTDSSSANHLDLLSTVLASNGLAAPNDAASAAPISNAFTTSTPNNPITSAASMLASPAMAQSSKPSPAKTSTKNKSSASSSTQTPSTPSSSQNAATPPATQTSPLDTSSTATPTTTSTTTPSSTSATDVSALPLASDNCPGETFSDNFQGGLSNNWTFGGSGALDSGNSAFASYQAPEQNQTETTGPNGLTMSIMPASAPNGASMEAGLMQSKFSQTYGYWQAIITLPQSMNQKGTGWAFWLIGDNWPPENDIAEFQGNDNGQTQMMDTAQHSATTSDSSAWYCYDFPNCPGVSMSGSNTHVFASDWEPDQTTWYLDGQQIQQAPTPSDFNVPMHIVIGSSALSSLSTPASFTVQSVRVFKDKASALACVQQVSPATDTLVSSNQTQQPQSQTSPTDNSATPSESSTPKLATSSSNNPSTTPSTVSSQPSTASLQQVETTLESIQNEIDSVLQALGIQSPAPSTTTATSQSPKPTTQTTPPATASTSQQPGSEVSTPTTFTLPNGGSMTIAPGGSISTTTAGTQVPTSTPEAVPPSTESTPSTPASLTPSTTTPTQTATSTPTVQIPNTPVTRVTPSTAPTTTPVLQQVQANLQTVGNEINDVEQQIKTLSASTNLPNSALPTPVSTLPQTQTNTGGGTEVLSTSPVVPPSSTKSSTNTVNQPSTTTSSKSNNDNDADDQ